MTHCSCSENVLDETKTCESHKNPVCKTDCCPSEQVVDCCTPGYLRLEKLRNHWANNVIGNVSYPRLGINGNIAYIGTDGQYSLESPDFITKSSGPNDYVPVPTQDIFQTTQYNGNGVAIAVTPDSLPILDVLLDNAFVSYVFVNTLRYNVYQECGKPDQLFGWYFDTNTENLEIFQNIPEFNLNVNVNRLSLLEIPPGSLTKIQKKQLAGLNSLYKISLKALSKAIMPRREGNIVNITDKTGQLWTIAINSADSTVNPNNTQFVIVASPAC